MTFRIVLKEIETNLEKIFTSLEYPKIDYVVEPAKPNFGDITCNAPFLLARHLKKSPFDIAKTISEKYKTYLGDLVLKSESHPSGYLNFFVDPSRFGKMALQSSVKADYGFVDLGNQSKIVIEHTSVNPNKALHIGHVRNVVIGDTLARILKITNYDVHVLNYVDDSGLQVADIIVGFKFFNFPVTPPEGKKFDQYCGDEVYVKTTARYESDPRLEEKRKNILRDLEDQTSEIAKFGEDITRKVLAEQLQTCWNIGATYDCLNFESQIIRSGLWENVFEKLKKENLVELETEGKNKDCWVIKGDKNEEDKVLVRSNGTATYIAKDIPYTTWKLGLVDDPFYYKQYAIQKNDKILWQTTLQKTTEPKKDFTGDIVITIIDSRQSRLQKIITSLMSKFKLESKKYLHLSYESVTLSSETVRALGMDSPAKNTQMSGRRGLYVNADSVIEMLEKKISIETKKRNPDLDSDIINQIVQDVAVGTVRYEMIKQDLDKIITFDLTSSLSLEGDTAAYLQYTHARACRILEKGTTAPDFEGEFSLLSNEYEQNLIKKIAKFELFILDAAKNFSPKVISKYCYDLAVSFNSFYEHVKVLDIGNDELTNARLCLVFSFKSTLSKGLELLGIASITRM